MRKKINKIFTDLVQYYKNIENVEETINEELQSKPACVHMSERVNEYENIHEHKYYEVLYVEKGSLSYLIDENEYIQNVRKFIFLNISCCLFLLLTAHKLPTLADKELYTCPNTRLRAFIIR